MSELHSPEIVEQIGYDFSRAAGVIANGPELDTQGADVVLRNLAVIVDRLNVYDYGKLDLKTLGQVDNIIKIAYVVAPGDDASPIIEGEDINSRLYRVGICEPLDRLQQVPYTGHLSTGQRLDDSVEGTYAIRAATNLTGSLFPSILRQTAHLLAVRENISYFHKNTEAAVKRAKFVEQQTAVA